MNIQHRVSGIPCLISYDLDEDHWDLCDRRGRHAPWLERKLTRRDYAEIIGIITRTVAEERDDMLIHLAA